ncbi:Uncharacterized protein VirK/YbjX [Pseudomonas syringae pv. actinidiae]|uniref:Uncharacterized protein VirK/YbjX n=1 Tax=Pseudomonas syringae pv. actinidiae TaxID=103796 RepID=A0A2V0QTL5_PSESF|nr:Uncharacterized protein VirK/YbjX [Pseudomonas syringae pv. actinidiae]
MRNDSRPQEHHHAHAPRGYAVLDASRPLLISGAAQICDAERHPRRSHAGVRNDSRPQEHHRAHAPRGYAVLDAPRPLLIMWRGADL